MTAEETKTDEISGAGAPAAEGPEAAPAAPATGISLTEKAAAEVKRIIAEEKLPETTTLRVGAKGGGCSGFTYVLDFDQGGKTEFDLQFESFGVTVLIDKKSEFFMAGTVIDFNAGLLNRGFVFNNPKAASSCGCGVSFQV